MIPDNWKITLMREGGWWAMAKKHEGVREITVTTGPGYPHATPDAAIAALELEILK